MKDRGLLDLINDLDEKIKNRTLQDHFTKPKNDKFSYYSNLISKKEAIYENVQGELTIVNIDSQIGLNLECKDTEVFTNVKSIIEYAVKEKINILPLPKMIFQEDEQNAQMFFAKTGYYTTEPQCITIFTTGRHPKDIVRSFCHELIHHMQNLRGDLNDLENTEDTTKGDKLLEIEAEAYLYGNLLFRNWEDNKKYNEELN